MLVLGISDLEHNSAVALVGSDGPVAAIEEEKLARSPAMGGLPYLSLRHCMQVAAARSEPVSAVGLGWRPWRALVREQRFRLSLLASRPSAYLARGDLGRIHRAFNYAWHLQKLFKPNMRFLSFEHHVCHAASAYYASDFDRALVLTLDESGDLWSGLLSVGEGDNLRVVRPLPFPNSLGWFYSQVTRLLGFRPGRDEHKTQWLSKEGTPEFVSVFRKLFQKNSEALPVLKRHYLRGGHAGGWVFSSEVYGELRLPESVPPKDLALRATIARSAQDFLEDAVVELAEEYRKKTGTKYLCVAGGIFQNVFVVRALEKRTGFDRVFVQPVAGNAGTALGAAHLAQKQVTGQSRRQPLCSVFWGPRFESSSIKEVLDNCKVIYRYLPEEDVLLAEAARLLHAHKIVAWYQGGMEFGLRALGHRSIVASPFSPYVVDNLNRYIKHRESFHPFVLSIPAERAAEFFDCTANCRFLASIGTLTSSLVGLEQFMFKDKDVRVHVVEQRTTPRFWKLLHKFGETAPAPILVDTSFNLFGEPLVSEPREAMRSFYSAGIDALVMENFLVTK